MEETTSGGVTDSKPMSVYEVVVQLERRGVLDSKLSGHEVSRPAAVQRGEEQDRIEITHNDYSVFRPNPVQVRNAKGTNIGGFIGYKLLETR